MTKAGSTYVPRKGGDQKDQHNMIAALCVLVQRAGGEVTISGDEWLKNANGVGLRARYEPDGGITLWTYDVVEDMKRIAGK